MGDKEPISINYQFIFSDNHQVIFDIKLEGETLEFIHSKERDLPGWTRFDHQQCDDCVRHDTSETHCPVASNIAEVVAAFKDILSYDKADVIVTTKERVYARTDISIQESLSSLLGIIMVTSGCENLDKLRPMVRFHLPFASIQETIFRSVSTYLFAQYFRNQRGLDPDWEVKGLLEIYNQIAKINKDIVKRLQIASEKDAGLNAVVILDTYAQMIPFSLSDTLQDFEHLFEPYLKS